jgi:hypothetical protein
MLSKISLVVVQNMISTIFLFLTNAHLVRTILVQRVLSVYILLFFFIRAHKYLKLIEYGFLLRSSRVIVKFTKTKAAMSSDISKT